MDVEKSGMEHLFDDAFHVTAFLCKELLVPLTNEAFGLKLPMDTKVIFLSEVQAVYGPDGEYRRRVMDTLVSFSGAPGVDENSRFHFECESRAGNIILRIVEYALMEGVKTAEKTGDDSVDVYIPRSAVIYLQSSRNTPPEAEIRLHTPGGDVKYRVPSVRVDSYDLEEIFERELYLLIPFYLLRYRDELSKIDTDEKRIRKLAEEMAEVERRLHDAEEAGKIQSDTAIRIDQQYQKVKEYLLLKAENKKQEVKTMDKSYWEDDWSIIDDPLFYQNEGKDQHLVEQVCKKLKRGMDIPQIADELESDVVRIQIICDIAKRFAPEYDPIKVFEAAEKDLLNA